MFRLFFGFPFNLKMAEYVDSAVQTVLSSSRLKLAHPGNAKLTQVYPTPSETTSVLAQAINHRGQFRVTCNNKQFNSRSDFILSSSALISEMAIVGSITFTNELLLSFKPNCIGWIFDMVESLEVTYSNSLMQNMVIRGPSLKDYSLLCCCSRQERIDLLKAAGQSFQNPGSGLVNIFHFALPLSFLNHTVASLRNSWPVDGSVLAGPIQISINWRPFKYGFVKTATDIMLAPPTGFSTLDLICKTTQLQDAAFSVKKAMMLDPQLVYSLPARYITTVDYTRDLTPGGITTINLSSAPSGMLEGIIVSIRPSAGAITWTTPNDAYTINVHGGSCTIDKMTLEFGGQNIFRADTYEEYLHWQRSSFGDTVEWLEQSYLQGVANTNLSLAYVHPVYFIPMTNDSAAVFRGHTNENLPSYGGSQLQLTIKVSANQRQLKAPGESWDGPEDLVALGAATQYEILVAYLVSGLLEISQGTVDLQL